jgi:predicted RNA-binding Zn-ribbon protein involved in translation (DUF1610 family)
MENKVVLMTYDVPEGNYYYGLPFVYYKDGSLFLEDIKVKPEDVESVLRAVKEYRNPEKPQQDFYHENLFKTKDIQDAYEYWFLAFTYQAIGGGLILWWDIQEYWTQELTRRGKHMCPKCGTPTIMYYNPFCPNCGKVELYKGSPNLFQIAHRLTHQYKLKDYHEFIEAFRDNCDSFGNDRVCDIRMPERNETDTAERTQQIDRLEMINLWYPFNRYTFYVSW